MNNIERLGYCLKANSLEDFLVFCTNATGSLTEPGVFEWLYSRTIQEAHFFTSSANDSIILFGATILKPDGDPPGTVPWTDRIKGFKRFLATDGEVGPLVSAFPQLTTAVTHNQSLDEAYVTGAKPVLDVFNALKATDKHGFSFTAERFAAALRGDAKVDRAEILSEIEKKLGRPLFEKPDLAKLLKSVA